MVKIVRSSILAVAVAGVALALTACGTSNAATATAAPPASVAASALTPAPTTATVTKVTVPSLAGLAPEVATAKLKAFGLTASITGDLSNPAFGVLTQEPAAATQVEPGIVVKVTVGESPAQATARQAAEAKAAADAEAARVAAEAATAAQAEADRVAAEQAQAEADEAAAAEAEAEADQGWYDERGWVSPETARRALDAGIPYGGNVPGALRCGTMCGEEPTSGELQYDYWLETHPDEVRSVPDQARAEAADRAANPEYWAQKDNGGTYVFDDGDSELAAMCGNDGCQEGEY